MSNTTGKIRKVLAAIDLSAYSKNVVEYAHEVSRETGAQLIILNIINQSNRREINHARERMSVVSPDFIYSPDFLPLEIKKRKVRLKALVCECGFKEKSSIKFIVDDGIPFEEILKVSVEEDASLLVIGPKGRTNLSRLLFGSVAEKLFRHSPVPVMSLR